MVHSLHCKVLDPFGIIRIGIICPQLVTVTYEISFSQNVVRLFRPESIVSSIAMLNSAHHIYED